MTVNRDLIERLTLWVTGVFIVCLLVYGKISAMPTTMSMTLALPAFEEQPSRIWVLHYPVTPEEAECLALDIYFEARSESPEAQYAVAEVVLYRVMNGNFPDTICGVIKDGLHSKWNETMPRKWKCAFTWFCDRKSDIPNDEHAFEVAKFIANDVLNNPAYVPELEYALYYHAEFVDPYWRPFKIFVGKIGAHLFYI